MPSVKVDADSEKLLLDKAPAKGSTNPGSIPEDVTDGFNPTDVDTLKLVVKDSNSLLVDVPNNIILVPPFLCITRVQSQAPAKEVIRRNIGSISFATFFQTHVGILFSIWLLLGCFFGFMHFEEGFRNKN